MKPHENSTIGTSANRFTNRIKALNSRGTNQPTNCRTKGAEYLSDTGNSGAKNLIDKVSVIPAYGCMKAHQFNRKNLFSTGLEIEFFNQINTSL